MSNQVHNHNLNMVFNLQDLAEKVDYSFMNNLTPDPQARPDANEHFPRQVFSGHYVPVKPTPLAAPEYIAHSQTLFEELGFNESLVKDEGFKQLFSGDLSQLPPPMSEAGWATGYALSIFGTEYIQQCPFQTGNGYGDGRAISVVEAVINGKRWEMQLKGAGRTPYCRGADGRAVLRSSVREFLAQEHMHALAVPTSRSLSLFVSKTDTVERPWYLENSDSTDPEIIVSNPIAISTRVAPSFLRVGQLELFGRRARAHAHDLAQHELAMIFEHLIEREYQVDIPPDLQGNDRLLKLAELFRDRLTALVADWLRVGYCQGNFNSDNCAAGGFTLDYGPFGFCEMFDPLFQPWTGGGRHFAFFNQMIAAEKNFEMFCRAMSPLFKNDAPVQQKLDEIQDSFADIMQLTLDNMWANKLGLESLDQELFIDLLKLMVETSVDYTIFFRELSALPTHVDELKNSFYRTPTPELQAKWQHWLGKWQGLITQRKDISTLSATMKRVNPKYTWREWLIVPAYELAAEGDYTLIRELQQVLTDPYSEQSAEIENKYYHLRPEEFFTAGGISHYSCSS